MHAAGEVGLKDAEAGFSGDPEARLALAPGRLHGPALGDIACLNGDADDCSIGITDGIVSDLEVAPQALCVTGTGLLENRLPGKRAIEVGLCKRAVDRRLILEEALAECDVGTIERLHRRRVARVEARVAILGIEREDRAGARFDETAQRVVGVVEKPLADLRRRLPGGIGPGPALCHTDTAVLDAGRISSLS